MSWQKQFNKFTKDKLAAARSSRAKYLKKRPHRSLRLSRRRDYNRSFILPGYWSFTNHVRQTLLSQKWLFAKFIFVYGTLTGLIVGVMSQESFKILNDTIRNISDTALSGTVGGMSQNLAVFAGVLTGAFNAPLTEAQQIYAGLLIILGWMTIVWLLRQTLAGQKSIRLRDGIYSSASPLVSTFVIFLVIAVQTIPFVLALLAYVAADSVNIFDDALFTTLFWIIELILVLLSSYWITSSLLALVIVTLPGMYPFRALKAGGDLVMGRRIRILYRLLWLIETLLVIWMVVLVPAIVISSAPWMGWLPLVPLVVLYLASFSLVWSAGYIYLLYRKLVEDGSPSA